MFSKLINSIRDTVTRTNSNKTTENTKTMDNSSDYSAASRRPSVTEEFQNTTKNPFTSNTVSEPISIRQETINSNKRRSSLFGISNVTYDDYVQKDLVSSSWS